MTVWLKDAESKGTAELLAESLAYCRDGEAVQFLVRAGIGGDVVQRLRVTLSRSRKRNLQRGRKNEGFTLRHSIYPFTEDGKRYDCVVIWTEKNRNHRLRELLDDTLEIQS